MSPDVPDAASVAAATAGVLLGQAPDLVLLLDVPALTGIVRLGGQDVQLADGSTVPTDRLTEALLVDTYAAAGTRTVAQNQRRAALRAAAGRTAAALLTGSASPDAVLREWPGWRGPGTWPCGRPIPPSRRSWRSWDWPVRRPRE
jgi:hypothetical protein